MISKELLEKAENTRQRARALAAKLGVSKATVSDADAAALMSKFGDSLNDGVTEYLLRQLQHGRSLTDAQRRYLAKAGYTTKDITPGDFARFNELKRLAEQLQIPDDHLMAVMTAYDISLVEAMMRGFLTGNVEKALSAINERLPEFDPMWGSAGVRLTPRRAVEILVQKAQTDSSPFDPFWAGLNVPRQKSARR